MGNFLSWNEVKQCLDQANKPCNLLLGNGFSISYDEEMSSYTAIHNWIKNLNKNNDFLCEVMEMTQDKNIEKIIFYLEAFKKLINKSPDVNSQSIQGLLNKINSAKEEIKNSFIQAIQSLQVDHIFNIDERKSINCYDNFLSFFLKNDNRAFKIFSTNYDLLMYWILMRKKPELKQAPFCDGFYSGVWGGYKNGQNIFYLHGNLCIFNKKSSINKEAYGEGNFLSENIEKQILDGRYPIFVAAGNSSEKMQQINENEYLRHCYNSLCEIQGSLVTYGFSFSDADNHILEAIKKASEVIQNENYHKKKTGRDSKLDNIYIGIYKESEANGILTGFEKNSIKDLNIQFFKTTEARIWD